MSRRREEEGFLSTLVQRLDGYIDDEGRIVQLSIVFSHVMKNLHNTVVP